MTSLSSMRSSSRLGETTRLYSSHPCHILRGRPTTNMPCAHKFPKVTRPPDRVMAHPLRNSSNSNSSSKIRNGSTPRHLLKVRLRLS